MAIIYFFNPLSCYCSHSFASVALSQAHHSMFSRYIPHVSINDIYHETHTFAVYTSLSIIHVAHKLITRLIHCRFVNLFDSLMVPFRAHATRYSSILTSLPCSFIRITWRVSSGIFYLNSTQDDRFALSVRAKI